MSNTRATEKKEIKVENAIGKPSVPFFNATVAGSTVAGFHW